MYHKRQQKATFTAKARETLADVEKLGSADLPDRSLLQSTLDHFGVKVAYSEQDGKTISAIYFPRYDQQDKVVGYLKRDYTLDKSDNGHFSFIGKAGAANKFFGQVEAEAVDRKRKTLIFVEGEFDVMSIYQASIEHNKGTGYEYAVPFVVGLSCGTANAVENVFHNKTFVDEFEELCLAFDNDKCSPKEREMGWLRGEECKSAVAGALSKSNLTTLNYGKFKDASDFLQGGFSKDLYKLFSFQRVAYSPEQVVNVSDLDEDMLLAAREVGVMTEVFPKLDALMQGFRPYELSVLFSTTSTGKSTVVSIIAHQLLQKMPTGLIMLEESVKDTSQRHIAQKLKVNFKDFRKSPLACGVQEAVVRDATRWFKSTGTIVLDHFGSLPIDDLMNKLRYFVHVLGCKFIVLDHLSMLVSGMKTNDERKALDLVMTELAAFCAANPVHILAVSHINRNTSADAKLTKDMDETESFWLPINKESMRGSAALEQLAWNLIALEPEIRGDRKRGRVRLVVAKNREQSDLGIADVFVTDDVTGEVVLDESDGAF